MQGKAGVSSVLFSNARRIAAFISSSLSAKLPHTRLLLVLFDPVSAGLWPRARKNKGLTPMQRFARWIAIRANPSAASGLSRKELRHILYVIRLARRKRGLQIQSNPLIKNQFNECCSKQ